MKKVLGFFPHIKFVSGFSNKKFNAQEEKINELIRKHEKEFPDEFVWGHSRPVGQTVYAIPKKEIKKETPQERADYCKRKGIFDDGVPEGHYIRLGSGGYSINRNY